MRQDRSKSIKNPEKTLKGKEVVLRPSRVMKTNYTIRFPNGSTIKLNPFESRLDQELHGVFSHAFGLDA